MIVFSKYLVPKGYVGITVFPFIILKNKALESDLVLINHESIHLNQQIELLIFPFYIWYVLEFIVRFFQYKNWSSAYRNISFEREAYAQENNSEYLKTRSFWNFFKYL